MSATFCLIALAAIPACLAAVLLLTAAHVLDRCE